VSETAAAAAAPVRTARRVVGFVMGPSVVSPV
jgi:hypothetical protein